MSSTLIVRDALTLVLGEGRGQRELQEHLRERVGAALAIGEGPFAEILELLGPTAGEDAQADVLSAALVLAVAFPRLAERHEITAVVHGRRLAGRLERDGDVAGACGALRLVSEVQPGNKTIERALAALMRRQGMVQDLVDRYLARAQQLLDQGSHQEAIPWLREVLQLDRSRKDVARTIRDLRFEEVAQGKVKGRHVSVALIVVLIAGGLALVGMREAKVRQEFAGLPLAVEGNLGSLRERYDALGMFIERYPIWHGSLEAMQEHSDLKEVIGRINAEELAKREQESADRRLRDTMANNARLLGDTSAQEEDFPAALARFREALEVASDTWPERARTQRDIDAIVAYLAEQEGR